MSGGESSQKKSLMSRGCRVDQQGDLSPRRLYEDEGAEYPKDTKKRQCLEDISVKEPAAPVNHAFKLKKSSGDQNRS